MKVSYSFILSEFERQNAADRWLNDVYCKISNAYYEDEKLSAESIARFRGIVEAAQKLEKLDEREADVLMFELSKIEQR
jgi:hypothetical protein